MNPQPIQENNEVKAPSHYPVLLLVAPHESLLDLASFGVHLGAHCIRMANHAGVFLLPAGLAPGGWLVFYQSVLYQTVPRRLKDVQGVKLDATLENATSLSTVIGKTGLLLEN